MIYGFQGFVRIATARGVTGIYQPVTAPVFLLYHRSVLEVHILKRRNFKYLEDVGNCTMNGVTLSENNGQSTMQHQL